MSKDLQTPQSEEVDLGQLFKLIGSAFDKFFRFIKSIFTAIGKLVLAFLLHLYKRFIWYVAVVVIGFVVGFIIDKSSDDLYGANLFIEANFNSSRQVYENIKQFHQLAFIDKDSVELSNKLKISVSDAAKLKGFYIEPDIDESFIMEQYSVFYNKLDSLSKTTASYTDFKETLTSYSFKMHRIGVASSDKFLYKKIEKAFIKQISSNPYLKQLTEVNISNIKKEDLVLAKQVETTDSLFNQYLKIRINESRKEPIPGSGTNLYVGGSDGDKNSIIVDESLIIEQRLKYEKERIKLNQRLVEEKEVVNVISGFPNSGYDISEWTDKKKFILPIALLLITLISFSLVGLKKYLDKQ